MKFIDPKISFFNYEKKFRLRFYIFWYFYFKKKHLISEKKNSKDNK